MKNSKFVNLLFIASGALIWFLAFHYVERLSGYFQLARSIGNGPAEAVRHGLPIVLGILTYFILRTNTKAYNFVNDCVDELFRVVFPGAREVRIGTFWVITLVIFAGIIFGVLDMGIVFVIRKLIGA